MRKLVRQPRNIESKKIEEIERENYHKAQKEVERLKKVERKTERLIRKASHIDSKIVSKIESIKEARKEIKTTRSQQKDLIIMLQDMEPKERSILKYILEIMTEEESKQMATLFILNTELANQLGVTKGTLKHYLSRYETDIMTIIPKNTYTNRPSKKFRYYEIEIDLREEILKAYQQI